MAASNAARVIRSLAKELKHIHKKENLQDVPAYAYLHDQMQNYEVTSEKICRDKQEVEHMAETYLCYLRSARKHEELSVKYRGRGERSIEDSAQIVGLKLPKLYADPPAETPEK